MSYRVVFSPEAEEQLVALFGYIADAASSDIAAGYMEPLSATVKDCIPFQPEEPRAMTCALAFV